MKSLSIRKKLVVFTLIIATVLLTACAPTEVKKVIIHEDEFIVLEIRFEHFDSFWDGRKFISVDTDQETFVFNDRHTKFMKTKKKESTLNKKVMKSENRFNEYEEFIITLNEADVRTISKEYADVFKKSLEFADN